MNNLQCKKKQIYFIGYIAILSFVVVVLTGCQSGKTDNLLKDGDVLLYYVDKTGNKIVSEVYTPVYTQEEALAMELLDKLKQGPGSSTNKSIWPDIVKWEKASINDDGGLVINFNSDYNNIDNITEVLLRTCIVRTMCQIEGIDHVEFYVGGQLFKINEKLVGSMEAKDFISTTGLEDVVVRLYFSNLEGNKLKESILKATYDGNISMERLIVEQLISGPIEEDMKATLPEGTALLKVTTTNGVCYVDFNEKFLDNMSGVKEEVVIYSVVNSLVELSHINKVQFSINGTLRKTYRETISFNDSFERNLEIVEGSN